MESKEKKAEKLPLEGKSFVFTGELKKYSRKEVQEIVENLGGRAVSSVSKNTDYVVAGENPGSKFEKAKELLNQRINWKPKNAYEEELIELATNQILEKIS